MSSVVISGDTSGAITLAAPSVAGTNTITLPANTGNMVVDTATQTLTNKTLTSPTITSPTITSPTITGAVVSSMASSVITSGTAVASTSSTSIDFTSIPSWVKRITVMLNGVSTSGTSTLLVQLGTSGGIVSTGYNSTVTNQAGATASSTAGFILTASSAAADTASGLVTIANISSTNWISNSIVKRTTAITGMGAGDGAAGGVVTQIRITTSGGTDTFDAGTINILYE